MTIQPIYNRKTAFEEFFNVGQALLNPDKILREKAISIAVYKNLTYDSHVDSCISSRESGLLSNEFDIFIGSKESNDLKKRDFIIDVFKNNEKIEILSLIRYIQHVVYWGYGVTENLIKKDGSYLIFDKIVGLPPEYFGFSIDNELVFFSKQNPTEGEIVEMDKVTLIQYRANYSNPYGEGKFARIFFPTGVKKLLFKYASDFAEKFGSIFLYAVTNQTDEQKKKKILEMLYNMLQYSVGVLNSGEELKTVDVNKSTTSAFYTDLINLCNAEISKSILGQTLTTEQGVVGSQSLGNVHFQVRQEIIEQDKKFVTQYINKYIKKLIDLNFSDNKVYPEFRFYEEDLFQKDRAERDRIFFDMGIRFNPDYYCEIYNLNREHFEITEPGESDNPFLTNDSFFAMKEQKFAEGKKKSPEIRLASIGQANKEIEEFFDKTKGVFSDSFKPFFIALKKAIENSSSYDEAVRNILSLTYTNDDDKIDEIGRSFLIADFLGRKSTLIKEDVKKFADDFSNFDINYLKTKIPMTKTKFNELSDKYKNYAFTVTGYESNEQIKSILEHLISVKERGLGFKEWQKEIEQKGVSVSPSVYWQNIKASQMAGLYNEMVEYSDIAPYWQYVAVVDANTSPNDLALNGIIRRYDDPFWDKWYPPNHFGCRCSVRALTKEYLSKKGYDLEKIDKSFGLPTKDEALKNISKIQDEAKKEESDFAMGLDDVKNKIQEMSDETGEINMIQQKGFNNNVGKSLFSWVKIKEQRNANSNWIAINKDKINFKNELKNIEPTKIEITNIKDKKIEDLKKEAKEYLSKILVDNKIIFDKSDNPIFIDVPRFIEHIIKTDKNGNLSGDRFKYLKVIPEILKNPDLITSNVYVMPNSYKNKGKDVSLDKKGMVKIGRVYVKKIIDENGKETYLNFVINTSKEHPDYNGWTFYIQEDEKGMVSYKR